MPTQTITRAELYSLLTTLRGATILSLTWESDPARYKADRGRVGKVCRYSGMVNFNYGNKKRKVLGIEVPDKVSLPGWKERVGETCVYRHKTKGTLYVEFYPHSGGVKYTLDGSPCGKQDIAHLIKPSSKYGAMAYRTITLDKIVGARINGTTYIVG